MKAFRLLSCLMLAPFVVFPSQAAPLPLVRFHTNMGDIDCQLRPDLAPITVSNFLAYVDRGVYANSFIHRSVTNFIFQGGSYTAVDQHPGVLPVEIPADLPIANEVRLSNTRGTLAMVKGTNSSSPTTGWFFNESDANAPGTNGLDLQLGGYTAFGQVTDCTMGVLDAIAALPIYSLGAQPFTTVPLVSTAGTFGPANLVLVYSIVRLPSQTNLPPRITLAQSGTNLSIRVPSLTCHTYQLQRSVSPASSTFTNVGTPQSGVTGTTLTFPANTGTGANGVFRVAVWPR